MLRAAEDLSTDQARIRRLEEDNVDLRERLERLETFVGALKGAAGLVTRNS